MSEYIKVIRDKDGKFWYDLGSYLCEVLPTDDCYYEYNRLEIEEIEENE